MTASGSLVTDRLSAALALRLKLDMSLSRLPLVEEWMDVPFSRWLDSVPMPPEMPDGEMPSVVVSLGAGADLVRWSFAGAPAGVVPKLVDYMRRAGALPADFQQVDLIGQALEPALVGSWIETRPGAVATGWLVAGRMDLLPLRDLLGEGSWLDDLGGGIAMCTLAGRSVGADPVTEVVVELPGAERSEQLAAAQDAFARSGHAFDPAVAAQLGGEALALGVRARAGQVLSVRLQVAHPGRAAPGRLCGALGLSLAPEVAAVEKSIGASEVAQVSLEHSEAGAAVIIDYLAGSARAAAN
jgi:hypothetical protein